MSRMQNILDKAEREGAVHRMRVLAEPMPAPMPAAVPPPPPIPPIAAPVAHSAAVAPLPDDFDSLGIETPRTTTVGRLDPLLVTVSAPQSTAAEQYRAMRTRLAHGDGATGVVMVTSPGRGDGKSLTAANLALAIAEEDGRRVCLVDANLRAPVLHRLFGLSDGPGLSDVLTGRTRVDDALVTLDAQRISILTAGTVPAHPAELLGTIAMRRTIDTLRARFDAVILDAPSAAPLADVGVITPFVDGVIVVVRAGATAKPAIHDTVAALNGRVLGVVLNDTV